MMTAARDTFLIDTPVIDRIRTHQHGRRVLIAGPTMLAAALAGVRRAARRALTAGEVHTLRGRVEEAEAALAREDELLHELRSTVVGITASYQLLHRPDARLSPGRRSRLEHLHEQELGRLGRLLADRGPEPVELVEVDLLIDPLVESLRARGHQLRWRPSGLQAHARADDLSEIVHVLLENAARHADGRGISVEVDRDGTDVEVRVSDHGPGIAPEVLPQLFERGARRADSPGQGIGLHAARRLATEMGGTLRLAPAPAGTPGTTFVLALPAQEVAACLAVSS